jgi:UDP-N-acetylmuramate dehydrogenase
MEQLSQLKNLLGEELKENIMLSDYSTMKVGGFAKYFFTAKNVDDLIRSVTIAKELGIKYRVIGGGSNIIFSSQIFDGLIILNRSSNIIVIKEKHQIIVDSGLSLARLIMESANHELSGLEPLSGIPGTVGGAIYGNAGAFGVEISQFVVTVTLLNKTGKIVRCKIQDLKPSYRSTYLKNQRKSDKEVPIILSIKLQLRPGKKQEIINKISYYKKIRTDKQPYDKPNCGSVFKNPGNSMEHSAGYILDKLNAKKIKVGDAQVSNKHANFVINNGNASVDDVVGVINIMKDVVREKTGMVLEEEIEYIK